MSATVPGPGSPADDLLRGLWRENPVFVQVLGMCPTLAVSNSALNAVTMGLATTFVLCLSSLLVSLLRNVIPREVRIASFILVIATFVTVVDYLIQAISLALHAALGAFISLIVVNCIILGRAEAFAAKTNARRAVRDALGMGVGFAIVLLAMGTVRELLGSGSFLGLRVFGDGFEPWVIMVLPPGGFLTLGIFLLAISWQKERRARLNAAGRA